MSRLRLSLALPVAALASLLICLGEARPAQDRDAFVLEKGDRICLLGNALAERMQHHGWLEALLQCRFPDLELSVRNLGFSADELSVHQRMMNFGKFAEDGMASNLANEGYVVWDRYLARSKADVVFAFFGYNESFAGAAGIEKFEADLEAFISHVEGQSYNGEGPPRLVLFSSIPQEAWGDPNLPDGVEHNARLALYTRTTAAVAKKRGVPFVDLFTPMAGRYAASDEPLTINGIHLHEAGNRVLAEVIEGALFPGEVARNETVIEETRQAVLEKNLVWFNRYRATDGYNTYGGRSREVYPRRAGPDVPTWSNFDVLQREMDVLDVMTANRDRLVQAKARGGDFMVDDSNAPPLIGVETNYPGKGPSGAHLFFRGEQAVDRVTPASDMEVGLFADEVQFPELVNPVQMAWDTRGRLWVACWPTYPHWGPGEPMNDRLLILEDVDRDGHADTCKTFAGDLHNPTGFEFWNGGVLVANIPDLLFLKDVDGDDVPDIRERVLHGISSGDSHHSANSFVFGPDGALYFQEGTFHRSQIETIHGPMRNRDGCVWRFDPRTWLVERYVPYNFANPHGHVFDRWGQDFVTDGTGNQNYYALPFSGYIAHPAKHGGYFTFFNQRSRPCAGTEILSSRHFPEENQGNYLVANVIGFQGIFQYRIVDADSGFSAEEQEPIVVGSDANFRPSDIEMGPDGAIYFTDWHNPIIGHLQHHIRDPSRDESHGRVYRVTSKGRAPLVPVAIAGRPVDELVELLAEHEDRVRYRVRIELSGRDSDEVIAAAKAWAANLDERDAEYEHHLLEALWVHQQHNRMDMGLLDRLLRASDPRARAAATRVLRYMRNHVDGALERLTVQANDEHPRVRLEAVVAASSFRSAEATSAALEVLKYPMDKFLDYALAETMKGLEPYWKESIREGRLVAADNPKGIDYLVGRVGPEELVRLPRVPAVLRAVMTRHAVDASARLDAATRLAEQNATTPTAEILNAIRTLDQSDGAHASHVLHDLGGLLHGIVAAGGGAPRDTLVSLAEEGESPVTRALGYASLVALDRSADGAWKSASASRVGLESFLGSVPMITQSELRAPLYDRIRPLMFSLPAGLQEVGRTRVRRGSGLNVTFFEPTPANATLEVFDELTPKLELSSKTFTLDFDVARSASSFGLMFRGTLFVPTEGRYRFFTNSDDGSRLFIDGRCVVNNDGSHAMRERNGEIDLAAGPHPIVVTYFDSGGGDGLVVSWRGPGFGKQPIPENALGGDGVEPVRTAAIRAMAHVPGHEAQKFQDATRFIGEGTFLDAAVDLLRGVPEERWPRDQVRPVIETMAAYVSGLPAEERTAPRIVAALELGRELAGALPASEVDDARRQLDGLGGSIILIRTLPHKMRYDVTEFWVEAGKPVAIVFQNNDVMPHNLVITRPGALEVVGPAAELLTGEGDSPFIPETDDVLWHTKLMYPGQSERLTFVAPEATGDHPFVCTFPGHWRIMNGVMHVVPEVDTSVHVTQRTVEQDSAPAREFVRDWTFEELEPSLADGWERGRDLKRGKDLFTDAGCIKCHTFHGEGAIGGPDLTKTTERFRGKEMLRQIVEPSAEILEGYFFHYIQLEGGGDAIGRIVEDDGESIHVVSDLQDPEAITVIAKDDIAAQVQTQLSPMPTGLLVTLSKEEILDLMAFLHTTDER